jgi:hypothetical protein
MLNYNPFFDEKFNNQIINELKETYQLDSGLIETLELDFDGNMIKYYNEKKIENKKINLTPIKEFISNGPNTTLYYKDLTGKGESIPEIFPDMISTAFNLYESIFNNKVNSDLILIYFTEIETNRSILSAQKKDGEYFSVVMFNMDEGLTPFLQCYDIIQNHLFSLENNNKIKH